MYQSNLLNQTRHGALFQIIHINVESFKEKLRLNGCKSTLNVSGHSTQVSIFVKESRKEIPRG